MDDASAPRRLWPRRVSWLTIILALLAVGTFLAISGPNAPYQTMMRISGGGVGYSGGYSVEVPPSVAVPEAIVAKETSVSNAQLAPQGMMRADVYYPSPYPNPSVPITDTREFLKVNYNAAMRTRDVQSLTRRVETTVRGYGGRVDQESSSPESGYVSFAVPESKYDDFRAELEGLVDSRFLTVNISSQNLLPQKQSIEEQQKQADKSLADYKSARQRIVSAHAGAVRSLQGQIDADEQQLVSLRAQVQTFEIQQQIQAVVNDEASLQARLSNENASYSAQLASADANIKYAQDWQKAVQTQDQALLDNVATVSGTVSIQWISLWDAAQLYLPGYSIPGIFALLAFLSLLYDRRRFGTL